MEYVRPAGIGIGDNDYLEMWIMFLWDMEPNLGSVLAQYGFTLMDNLASNTTMVSD